MIGPELGQEVYTYEELHAKYNAFMGPAFQVSINGRDMTDQVSLSDLEVETSIGPQANAFHFHVANAFHPDTSEFHGLDSHFTLGSYVEIKMGYADKLKSVMYGIITSVVCEFDPETGYLLRVQGMDLTFLMMRGIKSRSWEGAKYSDVVKMIVKAYGLTCVVDDSKEIIGTIVQRECSDYQMLTDLAILTNSDFFIIGSKMHFRKAASATVPLMTLEWGKSLIRLSVDMSLTSQVSEVVVRGWDQKEQKLIEAASEPIKKISSNPKTGSDIMKGLGSGFQEYVYTNVESYQEAKDKANAILNQRSIKLVTAEGECTGIPEIQAARYLELKGVGKKLSQVYYVLEAVHTIGSKGYTVRFKLGGNAI